MWKAISHVGGHQARPWQHKQLIQQTKTITPTEQTDKCINADNIKLYRVYSEYRRPYGPWVHLLYKHLYTEQHLWQVLVNKLTYLANIIQYCDYHTILYQIHVYALKTNIVMKLYI